MTKEKLIYTYQSNIHGGIKDAFESGIEEGCTRFIIDPSMDRCADLKALLEALKSVKNWLENTKLEICTIDNYEGISNSLEEITAAIPSIPLKNVQEISLIPYTTKYNCPEVKDEHIDGLYKLYKTLADKQVPEIKFDLKNTNISKVGILDLVNKTKNSSLQSHLKIISPNDTLLEIQDELGATSMFEKLITTHYPKMVEHTYYCSNLTITGQEYYSHDYPNL